MDVRGVRFTVFGMAKSGTALCRLLAQRGAIVRAADAKPLSALPGVGAELDALGIPFVTQSREALDNTDYAVLSPGVPADLPLFDEARQRGVHVTGDVEIAARSVQSPGRAGAALRSHTPSAGLASGWSAAESTTRCCPVSESASTAPLSQAGPFGRVSPRWSTSKVPHCPVPGAIASTAGDVSAGRWVNVGPPWNANGPNCGSVLC